MIVDVACGEALRHEDEETQRTGELVVEGKEVGVFHIRSSAVVHDQLPAGLRGDVVAEVEGKVADDGSIAPGQLHLHEVVGAAVAVAALLRTVPVVQQYRLLLTPVGRGEDAVVVGVEVRLQAGLAEVVDGGIVELL